MHSAQISLGHFSSYLYLIALIIIDSYLLLLLILILQALACLVPCKGPWFIYTYSLSIHLLNSLEDSKSNREQPRIFESSLRWQDVWEVPSTVSAFESSKVGGVAISIKSGHSTFPLCCSDPYSSKWKVWLESKGLGQAWALERKQRQRQERRESPCQSEEGWVELVRRVENSLGWVGLSWVHVGTCARDVEWRRTGKRHKSRSKEKVRAVVLLSNCKMKGIEHRSECSKSMHQRGK